MHIKFLPEAYLISGDNWLRCFNLTFQFQWVSRVFLIILIYSLTIGCYQKRGILKTLDQQYYQDVTRYYLPPDETSLQGAAFANLDRNIGLDLIWFISVPGKGSIIKTLLNIGGNVISRNKEPINLYSEAKGIIFFATGDIDGNNVDDLVLITSPTKNGSAKILFNNGKGYFFPRLEIKFPFIHRSVERVDIADIDQDGDFDFIFTGSRILNKNGELHSRQGQIVINNGEGRFEDATFLLWPKLPPGIVHTTITDFDRDGLPDIFLVYGNGQNRLLMNNGVGKFFDKTSWLLPEIFDQSTYADWADFDLDGDNDLLVTNKAIKKPYQSYSQEVCYFLENNGYGRFRKKPSKQLPSFPSFRVYLLDANGTGIPDAIILHKKGLYYLVGKGKWDFSLETEKRLPKTDPMKEITFGDINGDGFLDLLGLLVKNNNPKLWMNRFN